MPKKPVTLLDLYMWHKAKLIKEKNFERAASLYDQEKNLGSIGNTVLTPRQQRTVKAFLKILAPSE